MSKTVDEFVKQFTIEPYIDIEPHFELVKQLDIDTRDHKGCYNCSNTANQYMLKSTSWTGVQWCTVCNSLNVIYYQDRMSGVYADVIKCYQEKVI